MDANGATFIYNGTNYVPFVEPSTVEMATEMAADYFGKAVTALTRASNYINGVVAPYVAPVSSKIAELQTAAAGQLPEAVGSTLGKEVAIEGVGSTTVGTIAALAGPTVLPIVNYLRKGWNRSSELSTLKANNQTALATAHTLAENGNYRAAFDTANVQIRDADNKAAAHARKANDSFFSWKNLAKHAITVVAPFCVLPQVGFAIAGTAAAVGLTTRLVTHILNYRGEAKLSAQESQSADTLRQFNRGLKRRQDAENRAEQQQVLLAQAGTFIEQQNDGIRRRDAETQVLRNRPDHVAIPIDDDDDLPLDLCDAEIQVLRNSPDEVAIVIDDENAEEPFLDAPEDTVENRLREELQEANRNLGIAEALIDADVADLRRENERYKEENRRLREIEQEHIQLQQEIEEVQNL